MTDPDRLRPWERAGLAAGLLLVVAFGVLVEVRSAFGDTRRTDLGVYTRAGWAARAGEDPYRVVDDRGWHYCYPPPFAVLMIPLAEPHPARLADGNLPFPVSVAVWYAASVGCLAYAVHAFAGAVLPDAPRGGRRWWYARVVPVYVCLGGIGHTLGRGQVNLLVVALVAAAFAASVRGRRAASGAWLAAAAGSVCADGRTLAALVGWGVLTALPLLPGPVFDRLRECGLGPAATVGLWAVGLLALARTPTPRAAPVFLAAAAPTDRWDSRCPPLPARSHAR